VLHSVQNVLIGKREQLHIFLEVVAFHFQLIAKKVNDGTLAAFGDHLQYCKT
jgi:hypothetical protein